MMYNLAQFAELVKVVSTQIDEALILLSEAEQKVTSFDTLIKYCTCIETEYPIVVESLIYQTAKFNLYQKFILDREYKPKHHEQANT